MNKNIFSINNIFKDIISYQESVKLAKILNDKKVENFFEIEWLSFNNVPCDK
jgi:hypothetical protein